MKTFLALSSYQFLTFSAQFRPGHIPSLHISRSRPEEPLEKSRQAFGGKLRRRPPTLTLILLTHRDYGYEKDSDHR